MTSSNGTKGRLLVVDDEEVVVSLVRDALEDEGYEVHIADCGKAALQILQGQLIDLLITDIRMPNMTGIELADKAREVHSDIVVIFMTGYANLNSAKDAIKQGAVDYILKPFELSEIRQAVTKAMTKCKDAQAMNSDTQLEQLSDFSHMLVTAGDRDSLAKFALEFALMHCQSDQGAVLWWNQALTMPQLVVSDGTQTTKSAVSIDLPALLTNVDWQTLIQPVMMTSNGQSAIEKIVSAALTSVADQFPWCGEDFDMLVIPIVRPNSPYGFMMIGMGENSRITNSSTTKFLAISAGQLAMSLENLDLLEESQAAYARLKELQDETIQLEKMATRGEMSAEIGHELNNFVGVVAGNLSLLEFQLQKENYADISRYVRAMQDTIENIKRFTSNLMELTPIASKKEVIHFHRLLAEVIDYLKPQRRFRDVDISCEMIDHPILFEADSTHIQQLLYNLFNNAADATSGSTRREITVATQRCDDQNKFVFAISDTGSGIDPELLTKAFHEKFTTKQGGHGFGLLVCGRIIEGHGGQVDISSIPNEGTTIQVEFPMATSAVPESATV